MNKATSTDRLYFKRIICPERGNGVFCFLNGNRYGSQGFGRTLADQLRRAINCNAIKSLIKQGAHCIYDLRLKDALVLDERRKAIICFGRDLENKVYTSNPY
jgi:hypothetical protein